jgi:Spy/CpxP family protein refolding chaperone
MARTFLTALFVTVAFAASAQRPDFESADTPEMIANATTHTHLVDRSVKLTAEQKPQVQAVYLQVERQMKALAYRMQGQPKEDVEADMRGQYQNMDAYVDRELHTILTPDQLTRWHADSK